jgi:type III pantothenate kinase
MNLVVDVGNTATKCAIFENDVLIKKWSFINDADPQELLMANPKDFDAVMVGNSGFINSVLSGLLEKFDNVKTLSHTLKLPFDTVYLTPHTLGLDRIAAMAGGLTKFHDCDLFIVDAGTCITFDVISSTKIHKGGRISPGVKMRLMAMNTFTAGLPLVDKEQFTDIPWGNDTTLSLLSGAVQGSIDEFTSASSRFFSQFPSGKVIITGGDAQIFENNLKNNIFADPDLVVKGLNAILCLNEIN